MGDQQTAVVVKELGKPVEVIKRRIPNPTATQVLIKITAAQRK